jgi:CheY-like chemotaxis protein
VLGARSLREAHDALATLRPRANILDIMLKGEDAWTLLTELKRHPERRHIPVAVVTTVEGEGKALALGADAYCRKPVDRQRLLRILAPLATPDGSKRVLVADDVVVVTATALDDAGRRQLGELSAHVLAKDAVSREGVLAAVNAAMRLSAGGA